jgi:pseudaminic acid cytidylyltransferase
MNIAVIPARGGSKRIPHKNIRNFCGKPMIAWSIEAAQKSELFDRIIVSTDDEDILETAVAHNAEVPFIRPKELSDDHTPTIPVISHAVQWLKDQQLSIRNVCCIYATAPFLKAQYLREGSELLKIGINTQYVLSATSFKFPIFRAIQLNEKNEIDMIWKEHELTRSQDLPQTFHDAGQFYWASANTWLTCDRFFSSNSKAVIIPSHLVQDIDTNEDWLRAELMFQSIKDEH